MRLPVQQPRLLGAWESVQYPGLFRGVNGALILIPQELPFLHSAILDSRVVHNTPDVRRDCEAAEIIKNIVVQLNIIVYLDSLLCASLLMYYNISERQKQHNRLRWTPTTTLYTSNNQRLVKCVRFLFSLHGWFCIVFLDQLEHQCIRSLETGLRIVYLTTYYSHG